LQSTTTGHSGWISLITGKPVYALLSDAFLMSQYLLQKGNLLGKNYISCYSGNMRFISSPRKIWRCGQRWTVL